MNRAEEKVSFPGRKGPGGLNAGVVFSRGMEYYIPVPGFA